MCRKYMKSREKAIIQTGIYSDIRWMQSVLATNGGFHILQADHGVAAFCTALSGFPDTAGITDYGDGILRGTCLPALRSEVLRFAGAGRNQVHLIKYVCMGGNYLLMMFYTTVGGWMINYCLKMASGTFEGREQSRWVKLSPICLTVRDKICSG